MDIMTGLAAAGQAIDAAKKLRDLEKDFDAATFRLEIANLMLALADAKEALAEAQGTLRERDQEIARLKEVKANRMPVVSYRGYHFGIDHEGKSIGRPFCPICEKKHDIQVQISRGPGKLDFCPNCKGVVGSDYPWRLPEGFDTSTAI